MPTSVGSTTNTGLPIDQLINNGTSTTAPTQTGSGTQLGESDFLRLLTTQLQNQDPTQPVDDTQMVSQLAQFSALEAQTNLQSSFKSFQNSFAVVQSAGLIGHTATVSAANANGNSSSFTGKIATIQIVNGVPEFTMTDSNGNVIADGNGQPQLFTTSQITGFQ